MRFLLAAAVVLAALPAAHAHKPKLPELKYETCTLPNGLKVIPHEDHRLPLVAVDLWYHVGPLNERAGRTGFAHLFEHMMFEGSEHVGEKAHFKYLEAAGATDVNGTTSFDRTNYFVTLPAAYRAVTPADIARVAREDVHPDNLILVAVGDRAKIEPGLKAMNPGPVEHRSPTGEIVP